MSLGGGIGMMLIGFGLCYAAVENTYDEKTGKNKYPITPDNPFGWLTSLRNAFQGISNSQTSAGKPTGSSGLQSGIQA